MSDKRVLVTALVLLELLVIAPVAYTLVRVERQPLDVKSRLEALGDIVSTNLRSKCDQDGKGPCQEQAGRYVWAWSPSYVFDLKLLCEETECNLQEWNKLVSEFADYVVPLGNEFKVPLQVESRVVFHANVGLLRKGSTTITADSVKRSLHKIIDEAEVGGSGNHDDRPVNLVAWSLKPGSPGSDSTSYRIPGWGVVSFASPMKHSLGIFQRHVREVIFGLDANENDRSNSTLARRITLGRGLASVLKKLTATKALAESLPHLPIVSTVSNPFEEALDLVEKALSEGTDLTTALQLVRRASVLANDISSDPSLIPQLFVSDENLFAIFAPMILPTVLPLLIGCVQELKTKLVRGKKTVQ